MSFQSKFAKLPTFTAADAASHQAFPEHQAPARFDINPRALSQNGIGERDQRFEVELQLRAGFHDDVISLDRRTSFGGMDLSGGLLRDENSRSAFYTNRAFQLVASENTCRGMHQDQMRSGLAPT